MGLSTALVGMLPSYAQIGVAAPIALVALRMLQGLALGGSTAEAATYVAEHAPPGKRGLYTSWIQTTATLGLFLSLIVILICRSLLGADFEIWGWRIPFLRRPSSWGSPSTSGCSSPSRRVSADEGGRLRVPRHLSPSPSALGKSAPGDSDTVRGHGGPGGRLVLRAVLCAPSFSRRC